MIKRTLENYSNLLRNIPALQTVLKVVAILVLWGLSYALLISKSSGFSSVVTLFCSVLICKFIERKVSELMKKQTNNVPNATSADTTNTGEFKKNINIPTVGQLISSLPFKITENNQERALEKGFAWYKGLHDGLDKREFINLFIEEQSQKNQLTGLDLAQYRDLFELPNDLAVLASISNLLNEDGFVTDVNEDTCGININWANVGGTHNE